MDATLDSLVRLSSLLASDSLKHPPEVFYEKKLLCFSVKNICVGLFLDFCTFYAPSWNFEQDMILANVLLFKYIWFKLYWPGTVSNVSSNFTLNFKLVFWKRKYSVITFLKSPFVFIRFCWYHTWFYIFSISQNIQ